MRAQGFWCEKVDRPAEGVFEKQGESHEASKGLAAGGKLHEEIDVTLGLRAIAKERAEQTDTRNAELPDTPVFASEKGKKFRFRRDHLFLT